jgi:hypothetical protein
MFGQQGPKKKDLTPIGKGGIIKHEGKGAKEHNLPHRNALSQLTAGSIGDRTMNNYAKATPMANPQPPSSTLPIHGTGQWEGDAM